MLKQVYVLFLTAFTFIATALFSQNTDSLFITAKKIAAKKKYVAAHNITNSLIKAHPQNLDYQLLSGRIYAWQGKTDSAKLVFSAIIASDKNNVEAYDALTDSELWNNEYTPAIEHCKQALQFASEQEDEKFNVKIANAYYLSGDNKSAKTQLDSIVKLYPSNKRLKTLLNEVSKALYKNYISLSYLNVSFNSPGADAWNYSSLEYRRKTQKLPFVLRANYGNAYAKTAYQLEADAYPRFNKKTYMYLNAGVSSSENIFPAFNSGAEIYHLATNTIEVSAGLRYLKFSSADIFIFTAYLGKYYKKNWFAYRPFLVSKSGNLFFSHTAILRTYFSNSDNYMSLNLIYGATPYTTSTLFDISRVNSQRIGIDFQRKFFTRFIIRPMISYEYEEYFPGLFRDRFYGQLTLLNYF